MKTVKARSYPVRLSDPTSSPQNAIAFPLGVEAFMIYLCSSYSLGFPHGRGLAAASKGILLAVFSSRARFAYRQIAAIVRQAFQCGNRRLALVAVSHRYKSEPTGRSAHAIGHHLRISYGPIRREEIAQLVFGGGE
jgi:hypothetical protein